ncbi:MAG TPA: zinc transporter ZntB [Kofleriaceae bacterium]|jgi:zinc transporter|nr:zinc transporter ZntB [Kofleriaceae bacterium]
MSDVPAPPSGLLHAFVLDGEGGGEPLDWDGVERWRPEHGVLWINLDYATPDAEAWLGMRAGLDPVVREALIDRDPRPRALAIGDALLLVVRGVNLNQGAQPEDMVSVRCWIEPRRIVTMRHRPSRTLKGLAAGLQRGKGPHGSADFVAALVEATLEPVVTVVDTIDDEIAAIEDAILTQHAPEQRHRIAELRRRAIGLRRFIGPQRDAFGKLGGLPLSWLGDDQRARLREAADRQTRTVEELDAARDRASVTHEELQSRVDEQTSRRLYVLSLITAVFLPLTFVTGLLGVNVGGVPARDIDWAFWALCGLFAVATLVMLWLFRRWRWL